MANLQSSVVVNRPLNEVYDFVSNPANVPQWQESVREAGFVSGASIAEGTTIRHAGEMDGRPFEAISKVIRFEPNREVVYEPVSGSVNGLSKLTQRFAAEGTGTRISCQANVAEAEANRAPGAQQVLDADLASLKQILEG